MMNSNRDRQPAQSPDAAEAGRRYVNRGAIPKALLRDPIYRAWIRSHSQKASALAAKAESLSPAETQRLIQSKRELIETARPYMRALSAAAGRMRHAAMLSDEAGVLIGIIGDEETIHGPEPFPGEGTLLSEAVAGANGVGTTLAEGGYVELVGHEHFIRGFHPFTCQGVPIHDPEGRVIGGISTSVRSPEASERLRDIFFCAAQAIEAELLANKLQFDLNRVGLDRADEESLRVLYDDLVKAKVGYQGTITEASQVFHDKHEFAERVVRDTSVVLEEFKKRANLWRLLAGSDVGKPEALAVEELVAELLALLAPELARRAVKARWAEKDPIVTFGHRKPLARVLLRALLNEIETAQDDLPLATAARSGESHALVRIGNYV